MYDRCFYDNVSEGKIDIFGHHMHGKTSSYGELVKDGVSYEHDLSEFIDETYGEEGKPVSGLNHFTDYVELRKAVPEEFNLIMTDTPHFHRSEELYDNIYKEVKDEGGEFRKFDRHVYFEIDGKEAVVINSSEVGVTDMGSDNSHFTVTGLEMGYEEYYDMSLDELTDLAKESEITSVCHPYLPTFETGKELLYSFLEATREDDFRSAINYSTGYFPLGNELTRGKYQKYFSKLGEIAKANDVAGSIVEQLRVEKDVVELAEEYDLPLLPEIDSHAVIPDKLEGFGVLKSSAMEEFKEGEFPTDKLLDMEIINYGFREGTSVRKFFQSFSFLVPGWNFEEGLAKGLREKIMPKILNYPTEDYKKSFRESLSGLGKMTREEVIGNTYDPFR